MTPGMKEECTCQNCTRKFVWTWGMRDAARLICQECWILMMKWYFIKGFRVPVKNDELQFWDGHVEAWLSYEQTMREKENVRQESSS